jgi:hypothetical protein
LGVSRFDQNGDPVITRHAIEFHASRTARVQVNRGDLLIGRWRGGRDGPTFLRFPGGRLGLRVQHSGTHGPEAFAR